MFRCAGSPAAERGRVNVRSFILGAILLRAILFWTVLAALLTTGCTRQKYRTAADQEVYGLLNTVGQTDPLWKMDGFSLNQDGRSRYSSFYNQDKQPMPQDDAMAHRLMEKVDGKRGSKKWYKNGCVASVENPQWEGSLPRNAEGKVVLDQDTVFDLALIHSPEYRTALENVYLAALEVTGERFAFDTQFYGGDSLFFNNKGGFRKDSVSTLTNNLDSADGASVASRKLATGGSIVADIANSMVWTFGGGQQTFTPTTTLGYSITQPFLRGAGRQIVLERLTRSERQLLANVRQLAFYQQGFYVGVLTGSFAVNAPSSGGYPSKRIGSVSRGGYYGLLSSQVQIRNQESQVQALKENLDQYEEYFKAGKLTNSLQVEQIRSQFLSGQSMLVGLENSYQNSIDSYLISLGLPPDVQDATIQDALLDQFTLMSPTLTDLYERLNEKLAILRNRELQPPADLPEEIARFKGEIEEGGREIIDDFARLDATAPSRFEALRTLDKRVADEHPELDRTFCSGEAFGQRIVQIKKDYADGKREVDDLFRLMERTIGQYDAVTLADMIRATRENPSASPFDADTLELIRKLHLDDIFEPDNISEQSLNVSSDADHAGRPKQVFNIREPYRYWVSTCLSSLAEKLTTIRLIQTRARLETVELPIVDIEAHDAFATARENRLDWMNARSELVDIWRNIEITANSLKSNLSVSVSGQIQNEGNNPVNFSAKNANMYASVDFDAPLTRLLERNEYRRALISYDRARRSYYNYVDNVNMQIRQTLRGIYLNQMEMELKRESVRVAIIQVHQAQLKQTKPATSAGRSIGDTSARDLVDALNGLLSSQNSFMNTWLEYQVQRMAILLELGLFEIDSTGRWIDPGRINSEFLIQRGQGNLISQDDLYGMDRLEDIEQMTGGISAETLSTLPIPDEQADNADNTDNTPTLPQQFPPVPGT